MGRFHTTIFKLLWAQRYILVRHSISDKTSLMLHLRKNVSSFSAGPLHVGMEIIALYTIKCIMMRWSHSIAIYINFATKINGVSSPTKYNK